ncbi:DEKNAAC103585 [Brettanomyces naardenensis]|uniref:DEKNAAC103585 n=1 Tax=Brettanomyces naardenensis TaxID=13370 RepID=A0A448YP20_BRENA|nr:DEKNAAC103585 [Brettanomyces naardenensis]
MVSREISVLRNFNANYIQLRLRKMQKDKALKGNSPQQGVSVAFIRAKKDLQEYEEIPSVKVEYDSQNPMQIKLTVSPNEGYYTNGVFHFECQVPEDYPNKAPEFRCIERIYHPNIDLDGHVCLNILRNDWKPTLTLQLVFAGILHLFLHPNANDPLNKDAANDLSKFPDRFARHVQQSMIGGYVGEQKFDVVWRR